MLMIAEILLTIRAWKKGWRVRALLPMGIALGVCIFMGAAAGASGGSADDLLGLALLIELLGVVALIVMCARGPSHAISPAYPIIANEVKAVD